MAEPTSVDILSAAAASSTPKPSPDAEQITQRQEGGTIEARSTSKRIKTVEDLLKHIEADMTAYDVAASEATKWEVATVDSSGEPTVTELHRVWVRLKPKAGPSTKEVFEAMLSAASLPRTKTKPHKVKARGDLWQVLVISDTHLGRYCWGKSTGDKDYDLTIAEQVVGQSAAELIEVGNSAKPARRTILFLGDLFNADGPSGATTAGTPQDNDGRIQKVFNAGCSTLLGIVESSCSSVQTDVTLVNGNHDTMLTWAFQRILQERFRNDGRVKISEKCTPRQYVSHGSNLLGAAHGDKGKKRLPQLMAIEAAEAWSRCWYREFHTGHLHGSAAEKFIDSADSVITRVAPSLAPADEWHAGQGYVGNRQCMETFLYLPEGGLASMHVAGPRRQPA